MSLFSEVINQQGDTFVCIDYCLVMLSTKHHASGRHAREVTLGGRLGGGGSGVWDRELHQEADWRALGGWRSRHVEHGAVRARGEKRWRRPGADSSAKVALGES
jgi:hypothetical protein